ncbi:mechanosensitive ion channel family protein [Marinobacter arenosus]|uniref:mechanosensitive ion channel family protein n=1 Tax=Marinobacter arenosus TaxID=2856822 RepID=UPI001C4D3A8C|nr:mechanosensitive ion channel family protein [Marinobacter arenosus]MBW0146196.1 mechanosensitive ion channel family protein [Marinobacter arenosus]
MRVLRPLLLFIACTLALLNAAMAQAPSETNVAPVNYQALANPQISIKELAHRVVPMTKEQLKPLALAWQTIVQAETLKISDEKVRLNLNPEAATKEAIQGVIDMVEARMEVFERYSLVVDAFESKGGDPALVTELRTYRDSILFNETVLANPRILFMAILNWATRSDGGISILKDLGIALMALLGLLALARTAGGAARKWIGRVPTISKLLERFLVGVVFWLVLTIGILVVLASLGVRIAPLFAMIGGASFILAFALQDTLGNLASGIMIMVNNPFDEGDYVQIGGVSGTVKSVSIVATTVATPDNQVIIIPNQNVWGNIITNVTASTTRRVDLVFGISYEDSIPNALEVMERVVRNHPAVLRDPEPVLRVHQLSDSSVNLVCRPWVKTKDYWNVYWDLTHQMKEAFDAAGISIPYPQRDIHMKS